MTHFALLQNSTKPAALGSAGAISTPVCFDRTFATSQVLSTATGRTYEREAIVTWINANHNDPCDRTKHLRVNMLCPNFAVRSMIEVSPRAATHHRTNNVTK